MFSGIVESIAKVVELRKEQENLHISLECSFTNELKIDQSVAHNGVCLTVVSIEGNVYTVTAIQETLQKTNLGLFKVGDEINVERSMRPDSLLDGHIVQGHVDQVGKCVSVQETNGSWNFKFEYDDSTGNMTVEKGSICVNGVSLTVVNSQKGSFEVAIIPYTFEHTNFHTFEVGTIINLEFDIIGKYILKMISAYSAVSLR
ncbi:MAG: riboflavin synthase [Rikenellaceae bacterium]